MNCTEASTYLQSCPLVKINMTYSTILRDVDVKGLNCAIVNLVVHHKFPNTWWCSAFLEIVHLVFHSCQKVTRENAVCEWEPLLQVLQVTPVTVVENYKIWAKERNCSNQNHILGVWSLTLAQYIKKKKQPYVLCGLHLSYTVINVTLPDEKQNYVHRIGRVGRAERYVCVQSSHQVFLRIFCCCFTRWQ